MIKRGAFLMEASIMVANNLSFFFLWWIFFSQFKEINGWLIQDMAILMAIGLGSYGLLQICFGGIRSLSKLIISGDLDSYMTQPKNLILSISGSKSLAKGWGHLVSACFLLIFFSQLSWTYIPLIITCLICSCSVFASMAIIVHSLPFWLGSIEGVSKKYFEGLFIFALYPTNIYSGILQLVMFTLIPAGVITYLPVEILRDYSWDKLIIFLGCSLFFVGLAYWTFYTGLKRYESGNNFGMR